MRVLITGAGGFVGRHLSRHLLDLGHDVVAVSRRPLDEMVDGGRYTNVVCDLAAEVPDAGPIDALVHGAAEIPARVPDDQEIENINNAINQNAITAAARGGARSVLYLSSLAVYGPVGVPMVDEGTPFDNSAGYGRSKFSGEGLLDDWHAGARGLRALSLRLPGVIGKGSHDNFLSAVGAKFLEGGKVTAENPDAPFNAVVHVSVLVSFMAQWLEDGRPCHDVALIGSREPLLLKTVLEKIKSGLGRGAFDFRDTTRAPFTLDLARVESLGCRLQTVEQAVAMFIDDLKGQ